MTTDLEQQLSESLHRQAAELVPDGEVPPLPETTLRRRHRFAPGAGPRWRVPAVAAAAVLLIAVTTTAIVQHQRRGAADPTTGTGAAAVSRVLDRPAAAFDCGGAPSTHAAQVGHGVVVGIRDATWCVSSSITDTRLTSGLPDSGALRGLTPIDGRTVGVVDSSVSGVTWLARDGDESSVRTVDLYRLGTLRGFVIPTDGQGTLTMYSRSSVVVRRDLPWSPPSVLMKPGTTVGGYPDGAPSVKREAALDALVARARTIGASDDDFVDAGIDIPTNSVIVWRYGLGALTDVVVAQYQAMAPSGVHVQIRRALLTDQQTDNLNELVRSKLPALKAAGVNVNGYGGGNGRDKPYIIDYSGTPPTEEMIQQFQLYGEGTVVFQRGEISGLVPFITHKRPESPSSHRAPG